MNDKSKQEVINLLPWYHLGKLTDEEKLLVEEALETDPSLKKESLSEQQIMQSVKADKTLLDGSIFNTPTSRLDGVLAKLDLLEQPTTETNQQNTPEAKKPSLLIQFKKYFDNLLSGNSQNFTYAVFAALTVVQLSLLVLFISPSDNISEGKGAIYETASFMPSDLPPTTTAVAPMVLLIGMESNFKAEGFSEILGSNVDVEILPDSSGYYRINLSKKLSPQEIEDLKHELSKKHGKIWFIGEESL